VQDIIAKIRDHVGRHVIGAAEPGNTV